jgi:Glycosyl transferase family 11
MDYYNAAMSYVREREPEVRFFIFSDDPDWCRSTFPHDTVVGHNGWGSGNRGPATEHEDLYLMSLCNHAVICNSTFGWWGAWLGDEVTRRPRIVVSPEKWSVDGKPRDIVPERWIKL